MQGGRKPVALIRFYKPTLRRKDMDAVLQTMVDERIGPGERKKEFLRQFQTFIGISGGGIALRSYVDALKASLRLAGVGEGSLIAASVLSPTVYAGVASELGATLLLGDIDPNTGCLAQEQARDLVSQGACAILLHEPSGMIPYQADFSSLGVTVVEDVSQSLGSTYGDRHAGMWGDIVVCAFEEDGVVSTAGGAAIVFSDSSYRQPLNELFGATRSYQELPDMNAALGIVQISTIESQLDRRRELHKLFRQSLLKTPHKLFGIGNIDFEPNGYRFSVVLDSKVEEVAKFAAKYQVSSVKTFEDCVGVPFQDRFDLFPSAIPCIMRGLSFPLYPFLSSTDVEMLMKVISHLP